LISPLLRRAAGATAWTRELQSSPITQVKPNDTLLVDLRGFGADWYASRDLPDWRTHTYVVPCLYGQLTSDRKRIQLQCPLLKHSRLVDNVFISMYGSGIPSPSVLSHTQIDPTWIQSYPSLLDFALPSKVLHADAYAHLIGKTFYDPEARESYVVRKIIVNRTRDIVAVVVPIAKPGQYVSRKTEQYHVADVEFMLKR